MQEAALARHQLLQSSQQLYGELFAAHDFACEWQTTGLMLVYRDRPHFDAFASIASRLERDFDIRVARVPADRLTEQEPTLRDGLAGGWCFPGDSHLRPDKLMAGFRSLLPQMGVQVREGVEVLGLEIEHGQLQALRTSGGTLPVERMVLTAGAETPQFAKPLHCKLPIQAGKGYSLTFRTQQRLPRIPMIFEAHHVAVTPFEGALRIGSTMEFAGLDRSINRQRVQLLMKSARAHLREVPEETQVQPWAGWRPMTYDGIPRIGPTPSRGQCGRRRWQRDGGARLRPGHRQAGRGALLGGHPTRRSARVRGGSRDLKLTPAGDQAQRRCQRQPAIPASNNSPDRASGSGTAAGAAGAPVNLLWFHRRKS